MVGDAFVSPTQGEWHRTQSTLYGALVLNDINIHFAS